MLESKKLIELTKEYCEKAREIVGKQSDMYEFFDDEKILVFLKTGIRQTRKVKDLTGQKFNMLTAVKLVRTTQKKASVWLFRCDCGNEKEIRGDLVKSGRVKSCGCSKNVSWNRDKKRYKNNTTGNTGVWFDKKINKFKGHILYKKKSFKSGYYEDYGVALFWRKRMESYAKLNPTLEEFTKYAASVREEIKKEIDLGGKNDFS